MKVSHCRYGNRQAFRQMLSLSTQPPGQTQRHNPNQLIPGEFARDHSLHASVHDQESGAAKYLPLQRSGGDWIRVGKGLQ